MSDLARTPTTQEATRGFLASWQGLRTRLPGEAEARAAAASAFAETGLPGLEREAWKYTSLAALAATSFHQPLTDLAEAPASLQALPLLEGPRLVFLSGRFAPALSDPPTALTCRRFAEVARFAGLAQPQRDPLAALNTMLAEDGAVIDVPAGTDGGSLLLASLGTDVAGRPAAFHPRHIIRLEPGARLVLIEYAAGHGTYLHNPLFEISVGQGAHLIHIRLQQEAVGAFHLATHYVRVAQDGIYDGFHCGLGARLSRSEFHIDLAEPHAAARLDGVQLARGAQVADITTVLSHQAPNGSSRQTVRSVLDDTARGVFQGRIEVASAAQKTDGYQMTQALLLSPRAEMDAKPELEIFADDVKCSHGATIGELDGEQLFYLRSRGIPEHEARGMLVRAFIAGALDQLDDAAGRAMLEQAVAGWWGVA